MKPFLKWAGGKHRIIDQIKGALPTGKRLIDPFVGGGAVFTGTNYDNYILADINPDLINLYLDLQSGGQQFIDYCKSFFGVENNTNLAYYNHRQTFNYTNERRLKSALFLYLNRHCFNGLCRYNKRGCFNTSYGDYDRPYFPQNEMINFYKKSQKAVFKVASFNDTLAAARAGDIVYCDPPYVPLSSTANFTSYAGGSFTDDQQRELAALAFDLSKRGVKVAISNHNTDFTRSLYEGSELVEFSVGRSISANGDRPKVSELIALFGYTHQQPKLSL